MDRAGADAPEVFAVSYDPVDVLAEFAADHGITYALLSDVGSVVIEALGLLNRHAEQQQAHFGSTYDDRKKRMPHPGTFVLDADGIIVDRRFEQSHRRRPSGSVLMADALAGVDGGAAVSASASGSGLQVRAWLHTGAYRPQQQLEVRVALAVDAGAHVYVEPVPKGFTPLTLRLQGPKSLAAGDPPLPAGVSFRVEGLDQEFLVVDGKIRTAVPFRIDEGEGHVALELEVAYQACTAMECFPPEALRLELALEGRPVLRP
ncbi:MAG: redoxin domain-containing protein [Nitriliruptorales bacterium]|nr:redoxin domain-containing protein [Nitriliruptorales bacterium]